ncbi:MAG: tetratricopeptide repeat protein [Pseudomonadota bacterium]
MKARTVDKRVDELIASGKCDEAILVLQKELAKTPDDPRHLFALGVCHFRLKNFGLALTELTQLVDLSPSHKDAWFYKGLTEEKVGDLESARKSFVSALGIDPNFELAIKKLAKLGGGTSQAQTDGEEPDNHVLPGFFSEQKPPAVLRTERFMAFWGRFLFISIFWIGVSLGLAILAANAGFSFPLLILATGSVIGVCLGVFFGNLARLKVSKFM